MSIVVDNCCKSLCDGCPWADEQKRLEKIETDKREIEKSSIGNKLVNLQHNGILSFN